MQRHPWEGVFCSLLYIPYIAIYYFFTLTQILFRFYLRVCAERMADGGGQRNGRAACSLALRPAVQVSCQHALDPGLMLCARIAYKSYIILAKQRPQPT